MLDNKQQNNQNDYFLKNIDTDEAEQFMNEVGTLVFQSALMKYLAVTAEDRVREFETFINLQINSNNFFENLQTNYPDFGGFLDEEMKAFHGEVKSLVK